MVDWFGPINFSAMDEQFSQSGLGPANHNQADSPESRLFGQSIAAVPDRVKAANPETYITADDPPFFIQHGTADSQVPTQQSVDFAARLKPAIGANVTLELLQGAGHADPAFTTPENVAKVLDFLDSALKSK